MTHPLNVVSIKIDNETHPLRLTLGALADIEDRLGGDVESLKERLKSPRIGDILLILHALLTGGGAAMTLEALRASNVDLNEAAGAIAKTFESLGAGDAPGKSVSGEG